VKHSNIIKSLRVEPYSVCFEFCGNDNIPTTKNDVKIVLVLALFFDDHSKR